MGLATTNQVVTGEGKYSIFCAQLAMYGIFVIVSYVPVFASFRYQQTVRGKQAGEAQADAFVGVVPLLDFIRDSDALEVFKKYLVLEFCVENIMFYQVVLSFRNRFASLPFDQNLEAARSIYKTFIASDAELQVNLPARAFQAVRSTLDALSRSSMMNAKQPPPQGSQKREELLHIFDEPQREIFRLMSSDSYVRFCSHPLYANYLKGKIEKSPKSFELQQLAIV